MNKSRLEAFSDGVFAIVITLLILDIRIPEVSYVDLPRAIVEALPHIFAYVSSFIIIGVYWVSHHNSLQPVKKIDRTFLWMNMFLLLCISFLPLPTSLLGRFPFKALPIIIYGFNLIACNAVGFTMGLYLKRHPDLAGADYWEKHGRQQVPIYASVNGFYLLGILLAKPFPIASYAVYALVIFGLVVVLSVKNHAGHHESTP